MQNWLAELSGLPIAPNGAAAEVAPPAPSAARRNVRAPVKEALMGRWPLSTGWEFSEDGLYVFEGGAYGYFQCRAREGGGGAEV